MPAQNTQQQSSQDSEPQTFSGFDIPRQNWFKMPNDWTNITAEITSLAELKIVEYVLKHTWGYQEYDQKKRISIDEFMSGRRRIDGSRMDKGTGLSKPSVVSGVKAAVKRGLLIEEKDDSDKGRVKKYYTLRMRRNDDPGNRNDTDEPDQSPPAQEENNVEESIFTPDVKNLNRGVKNLYPRGKDALHRTEKDTLERHLQERTATRAQKDHNNNTGDPLTDKTDVVVALTGQGIAQKVAQQLANRYRQRRIEEKIDFLEYLLAKKPDQVQNPRGWLRKAIEEDYSPPDGYISSEERQRIELAEKQQEEAAEAARREAEEQAQHEKAAKKAQQAAFEEQLAHEWGTDVADRTLWNDVQLALQQNQFSPTLLASMQLLKLDDNVARIGINNDFAANQVRHPNTIKLLEREFQYFTKQDVSIELVVIGSPNTNSTSNDQVPEPVSTVGG